MTDYEPTSYEQDLALEEQPDKPDHGRRSKILNEPEPMSVALTRLEKRALCEKEKFLALLIGTAALEAERLEKAALPEYRPPSPDTP